MKNDDMEDMFKKAADNYELNEELAADWNNVRAALQEKESFATSVKKENKRKIAFAFWWLLLIPVILIVTYKAGLLSSDKKQNVSTSANKKTDGNVQKSLQKTQNETSPKKANKDLPGKNSKNFAYPDDTKNLSTNNKNVYKTKNEPSIFYSKSENKTQNVFVDTMSLLPGNTIVLKDENLTSNQINKNTSKVTDSISNSKIKDVTALNSNNNSAQANTSGSKKKTYNYTRAAFAYTGITVNTDLSFIKFQKISLPGFSIGVTGGYHFKNGISIESGLLYDKKNYFTKGRYFNKSGFNYLKDVNLLTTNGNCNMWELPVNFSYDFAAHKNLNWFVTTGVSSYFMHRELYNFKYEENGTVKETTNDYYHSSPDWFSVLNIGAGINVSMHNKYFLQVQPYYKIPISTIGKGNLSLSSGGINISLKRRLP